MTCCGHKDDNSGRFHPDFRTRPLTEKFYARHDSLKPGDGELQNIAYFEKEIEKRLKYDPRNQWLAPITENQVYGWNERLAIRYFDEQDRFIMEHARHTDETTRVLMKISYDMKQQRLHSKK